MYKDRGGFGGGSSRSEIVGGPLDRKRINDALDKHLEKSSPSTSRGLNNSSKDKERLSVPSTSTGKSLQHQQHLDHHRADSRAASLSKNKCSDGSSAFSWFFVLSSSMSLFLCVFGNRIFFYRFFFVFFFIFIFVNF
ncbi:CASEIN KINASE II SUBUNIT BETA [Salix koriyanagi]|uniref:CASEIN KINASE II SUBUNIT BETA n=1 Tax=Salix koriyanagi TaxID=2511006 RepID=A0A9Q0U351_9ROSI|nr:CASEIN KINASE II SUBUNIT BETA [Salix koriyanagi]